MNVAIFVDAYLPIKNGVVTSVNQLKAGMEAEGHKVYIFTVSVPGAEELPDVYRFPSMKFGNKSESRYGFVSSSKVRKFMIDLKIDLVHTHSEFSLGKAGKKVAKKLGLPFVHTNHTLWQHYTHYVLGGWIFTLISVESIIRGYLKGFKYLIAPSIKAENYFKPLTDKDALFRVIPNGVDQDKFVTKALSAADLEAHRASLGLAPQDMVAMFAGRIGPEKRVVELLHGILPILKKHPNFKFMLVGEGPSVPELKKVAHDHNVGGQLIFTGFINWTDMHKYYSVSQCFITASISEVHPMTLIEAAIAGLPAITRNDEAYLTLLKEGENGYLVESDEAIGPKLEELFGDKAKLAQFIVKSKELALMYTASNHVKNVKNFYDFILDHHKNKQAT